MDLAKEVRDKGGDMSKCPWKIQNASAPAASAQDALKENTIVEYGKDGSISRPQLKTVFGMELGTTVTLKHPVQTGGATLVYHIGKIDGSTVTLVGTGENSSHATTTVGELVDLYKTTTFVEDILVRVADIPAIETYADVVADPIKASVTRYLHDAFRMHQSRARIDLKIKGNDTKLIFASGDYKVGQLKLMPLSKTVTVAVEGKGKNHLGATAVEMKFRGPKGVTYVAAVQKMDIVRINRINKQPFGDAMVAPYWLVRSVQDKNMANMRKSTLTCTMTIVAGDEEAPHRVTLPIMQNIKALKGGDELVFVC